jgi:RNA polymerase sigma-70 factor (ECF subfamily)
MLEDRWLVWRLKRGSKDALGRIYGKYKNKLFALALSLTRDRSRAEDALHDAFVGLARAAIHLEPKMNLPGYLAQSVANRVRNQHRDLAYEELVPDPPEPSVQVEDNPEDEAIRSDLIRRLEAALIRLPEPQSEVILLHVQQGLPFREIAEALNISINTAQSRYRYGLDKLRADLGNEVNHEVTRFH